MLALGRDDSGVECFAPDDLLDNAVREKPDFSDELVDFNNTAHINTNADVTKK